MHILNNFVFHNVGGDGYSVGSSWSVGHAHGQTGEADRCWCFSKYNVTEWRFYSVKTIGLAC